MKLYSTPRPLYARQLRPGDQIATVKKTGALLRSETVYFDADLAGQVVWSVVHNTEEPTGAPAVTIRHTLGESDCPQYLPVMVREVIHIDPWSYVHSEKAEAEA